MLDQRGRLLRAALGFAGLPRPSYDLRSWLDSWRGIGDVERGMARQGYDLQLTRYDERGGATFYTTGMEHSITNLDLLSYVVLALPPFQIWPWGVAIVKLHALSQ